MHTVELWSCDQIERMIASLDNLCSSHRDSQTRKNCLQPTVMDLNFVSHINTGTLLLDKIHKDYTTHTLI